MALVNLAPGATATPVPVSSPPDISTEVGDVDPGTGEIRAAMTEAQVASTLGGEILSVTEAVEKTEVPAPALAPAPPETTTGPPETTGPPAPVAGRPTACEQCGKSLAGENQDYVKLSQIKYRAYLCNADYLARKKAS